MGVVLARTDAAQPLLLLRSSRFTKNLFASVLQHSIASSVRALRFLSAWDVHGMTPLGPLPTATVGCNVAAPRCQASGGGDAVAVPPPHVSSGERFPVFWFFLTLRGARPRSESLRRVQRGVRSAPFPWAPATRTMGHFLGDKFKIAPHVLPLHIP